MSIDVINFLEKNGFKRMKKNYYANDMCNVVFQTDDKKNITGGWYAVSDNKGDCCYSHDINIYWLIGYLTWNSFIGKDYIK